MDNSTMQSQGSLSSINASIQVLDTPVGVSSSTPPSEFVNHGLLLWNQNRQRWIDNKKHSKKGQQSRDPKIRKMAVARVALLKNLQQKTWKNSVLLPCTNNSNNNIIKNYVGEKLGGAQVHGWKYGLMQRFSSSSEATSDGQEVAVQSDNESGRKKNITSKWRSFLPRPLRNPTSLWRRKDHPRHINPFDVIPTSSLGNALIEAAENMNRVFENVIPTQMVASPSQLMGKFKETDESYKLKYDVPGLAKEDLKVTVDNGVLRIRGERKVEEEDESEDEYYMSYGYYNTSLALPDDAKHDDIKAELKDGLLSITIPKTESHGKDVKEVKVS